MISAEVTHITTTTIRRINPTLYFQPIKSRWCCTQIERLIKKFKKIKKKKKKKKNLSFVLSDEPYSGIVRNKFNGLLLKIFSLESLSLYIHFLACWFGEKYIE